MNECTLDSDILGSEWPLIKHQPSWLNANVKLQIGADSGVELEPLPGSPFLPHL